jgi:hypothetical protein
MLAWPNNVVPGTSFRGVMQPPTAEPVATRAPVTQCERCLCQFFATEETFGCPMCALQEEWWAQKKSADPDG